MRTQLPGIERFSSIQSVGTTQRLAITRSPATPQAIPTWPMALTRLKTTQVAPSILHWGIRLAPTSSAQTTFYWVIRPVLISAAGITILLSVRKAVLPMATQSVSALEEGTTPHL